MSRVDRGLNDRQRYAANPVIMQAHLDLECRITKAKAKLQNALEGSS